MYPTILNQVRKIIMDNMVEPEEVLVAIDENGKVIKRSIDNAETFTIYETMRETLIYLTNIDIPSMK